MVRFGPLRESDRRRVLRGPFLVRRSDLARFGSLCGLLVLTMLAIGLAARPDTWKFFQRLEPRQPAPAAAPAGALPVRPSTPQLAEPVILAQLDSPPRSTSGRGEERHAGAEARAGAPERMTSIDSRRLEGVKDWTRVIPERPYYDLLAQAAHSPPDLLERLARRDVLMAHLKTDPAAYRGKLIFLQGHLQRLVRDPNLRIRHHPDLKVRYEGWLYTDDSGTNPYVVFTTHIPEGMPVGARVTESVSVAGYFLEWWFYTTREGQWHPAPIVIGNRLIWHEAPQAASAKQHGAEFFFVLLLGIAGFLMLRVVWIFFSQQKRLRARRLTREHPSPPAELDQIASETDWDRLRALEERDPE